MTSTNTRAARAVPDRQTLGRWGEKTAAEYLESQGYRIIARNWRTREGEIDLIAQHEDCCIAVEVKTRSGLGYGNPLEAITRLKARRLRRLLLSWARAERPGVCRLRVDAVGITVRPGEQPRIDHLRGIV